ncbi:hypothetical protein DOTSEDRAFT_73308 [Dothistroma septosporum NZE10]|uniref:F-box domain-containing protein n=1 Tax=Dothistroma septosporum (strain NZE10 / CBS 128990) TaxID=675120 RepID=N1PJ63_DOTSN|nr:hypothetical protein DOTSEDRAFT_73308 [Dothistroma septosporum NZE10]
MAKTKTSISIISGLDYSKCKRAELDSFHRQRLHNDVPKGVNKHNLIQILRRQDQEPGRFRFLDLPAEMRNIVYRELLVLPQPDSPRRVSTCQLAIIRTCRQIRSEAHGILYGENKPEICLAAHDYSSRYNVQLRRHFSIPLFSKRSTDRVAYGGFTLFSGTTKSLALEHLPRFHSVIVRIDIGDEIRPGLDSRHAPELLVAVNQLLYCLCTLLAATPQKRALTLKLSAHTDRVSEQALHRALWPITRLGPDSTVHFTGVSKRMQKVLRAACTTSSATPNLIGKLLQAQPRAEMTKREVRKLGARGQALVSTEITAWRQVYRSITSALGLTKVMDEATEQELTENLAKFERMPSGKLADLIDTNIAERIKDLENLRTDLKCSRG